MKKLLSTILAISLATMLSVPAFAATKTDAYQEVRNIALSKGAHETSLVKGDTFYSELKKPISDTALNAIAKVLTESSNEFSLKNAQKLQSNLNLALKGEAVIGEVSFNAVANSISAAVTVQGRTITAVHQINATPAVAAPAGTAIIKNTGVSVAPIAILGLFVASAVGIAVISVYKLDLINE